MGNEENTRGKKRVSRKAKKRRKVKIITFVVEAIVLLCLAVAFWVLNRAEMLSKIGFDDEVVQDSVNELSEETLEVLDGYTNIALFGIDTRTPGALGKGNRSDTIMIASINNETKDIKVCSVYRDTYLNLANDKYHKCNGAYSSGGPDQAVAMLNMNMDLNIQYYLSVDFSAVSEVVDLLGGVEIEVDEYEIDHLNNYTIETSKVTGKKTTKLKNTGLQNLDGVQATSYCRIRYTAGDDFKRTERQREVLEAMANKAKTMDLATLDEIIKAVFPMCATNMKLDEMLLMAKDVLSYNIVETAGFPFDKTNKKVGGQDCVIPVGLKENVEELHKFLFNEEDYTASADVEKISKYIVNETGVEPEEPAEDAGEE